MDADNKSGYAQNLGYAAFAGQAGCASASIVIGSLLLGLWVDSLLEAKPIFTLICVISSGPISLFVMLRMVLSAIRRITPPTVPPNAAPMLYDDEDN
jgi:hypothetical protein